MTITPYPAEQPLQAIVEMDLAERDSVVFTAEGIAAVASAMHAQALRDPAGKLFSVSTVAEDAGSWEPLHGVSAPIIAMRSNSCGHKALPYANGDEECKYFEDLQPGREMHVHTLALCADETSAQLVVLHRIDDPGQKPSVCAFVYRLDQAVSLVFDLRDNADPEAVIRGILEGRNHGYWNYSTSFSTRDGVPHNLASLARYVELRSKYPCTGDHH